MKHRHVKRWKPKPNVACLPCRRTRKRGDQPACKSQSDGRPQRDKIGASRFLALQGSNDFKQRRHSYPIALRRTNTARGKHFVYIHRQAC